jgi:hypothetical protein
MIQQNPDKVVKHEVNHLDEFYLMYNKLNLHFREKKIKNIKSLWKNSPRTTHLDFPGIIVLHGFSPKISS